jgi:phage tail-like protein
MALGFTADLSVDFSFSAEAQVDVSLGTSIGSPMALGGRKDPFLDFRFAVEVESLVVGGFSEVDGLQMEIEVQEYREGGLNTYIHKRAGPAKCSANLVLKKGISDARALSDWYWDVVQGTVNRKNLSVLLLDYSGQEQARWNFEQAYPVKWSGPPLRGTANEVAIEAIELAHKGFRRTK